MMERLQKVLEVFQNKNCSGHTTVQNRITVDASCFSRPASASFSLPPNISGRPLKQQEAVQCGTVDWCSLLLLSYLLQLSESIISFIVEKKKSSQPVLMTCGFS